MNRREDNKKVLDYIKSLDSKSSQFDDIHSSAPEELQKIQLSYSEAQLVAFIFQSHGCKNILELGTLVGYSASIMAAQIDNCKITTIEKDRENYSRAQYNFQSHGITNVNLINIDAMDFAASYQGEPFDGIFIDANKSAYPKYLEVLSPHLKSSGVIIADNTLLWGEVVNDESHPRTKAMHKALREYNSTVFENEEFESIIIPTLDGLTVSVKK